MDREIVRVLLGEMQTRLGVTVHLACEVQTIEKCDGKVSLTLRNGTCIMIDNVLYAAGRSSNVADLNLDAIGVKTGNRGRILVNERYQTSVPNIYAAGDVIGFPALASTSMEQARVAMVYAFDLRYKEAVSAILPIAIYTVPEIAMVGLSEDACREQGTPYLVGRSYYSQNARGQIIGDSTGMLKLIFSPSDKRLLGAHLIGELASELIHIAAQVMATQGAIDDFIAAVYNFPSLS